MNGSEQLNFELGHWPGLGREHFLVSPSNAEAMAWIESWPDWPGRGLVLVGPPGCGKTHLAAVWRSRSGAKKIDGSALDFDGVASLAAEATGVVVEGAEAASARPLLHLHNALQERGAHLLLTARKLPRDWGLRLPDLASRIAALPLVCLGLPDDALLGSLLQKLFADRQLKVSDGLVEYLLARMERSFSAARALVAALDKASLAQRRNISVALARGLLRDDP